MMRNRRTGHPKIRVAASASPFVHPFLKSESEVGRQSRTRDTLIHWIKQRLGPVPQPARNGKFRLEDIVGPTYSARIAARGLLRFHALGDTGSERGREQHEISKQMAADFSVGRKREPTADLPAFLLHLGDVIYGANKHEAYRDQFYRPYKNYPGKIIAIAGNHDGETFKRTDSKSLAAFLENFCASTPKVLPVAEGAGIFREAMCQPGVHWCLETPVMDLIGLYSNIAEGPGFLEGPRGNTSQISWLTRVLAGIRDQRRTGNRKALVVATHHPPFSNGGHRGSKELLEELDKAFLAVGLLPDLVLSGHSHNYQRHKRILDFNGRSIEIPYLVAGCGGNSLARAEKARGQISDGSVFERSVTAYGFVRVAVSARHIEVEYCAKKGSSFRIADRLVIDVRAHHANVPN